MIESGINRAKWLFLSGLLFFLTVVPARSQSTSVLNWGMRIGLAGLSANYCEAYMGDTPATGTSYKNRVGYNAAVFARINLNRMFMQPELTWNNLRQDLSFTFTDSNSAHSTDVSIKAYSAHSNVMVGYDIVKDGPFILNVMFGPSFKYVYRTNYEIGTENYTHKEPRYKYGGIAAFSFNIYRFHFDIRYELNRPDTDIHFNEISDIPESLENIYIHKNENILNFSLGVMF